MSDESARETARRTQKHLEVFSDHFLSLQRTTQTDAPLTAAEKRDIYAALSLACETLAMILSGAAVNPPNSSGRAGGPTDALTN